MLQGFKQSICLSLLRHVIQVAVFKRKSLQSDVGPLSCHMLVLVLTSEDLSDTSKDGAVSDQSFPHK